MSSGHPAPEEHQVRRRPGGRAATVRAAVHAAAIALLEEVGYDRLQLPEVAARAGVNKTTVYRRWPTKQDLVAEVIGALAAEDAPTPDTGSLVGDLEVLLAEVAVLLRMRVVRAAICAVVDLPADDPRAAALRADFWGERFARSAVIVERAVVRGELEPDVDPRRYLEQVFGPLYLRLLVIGEEVDRADLAALARRSARRADA